MASKNSFEAGWASSSALAVWDSMFTQKEAWMSSQSDLEEELFGASPPWRPVESGAGLSSFGVTF